MSILTFQHVTKHILIILRQSCPRKFNERNCYIRAHVHAIHIEHTNNQYTKPITLSTRTRNGERDYHVNLYLEFQGRLGRDCHGSKNPHVRVEDALPSSFRNTDFSTLTETFKTVLGGV